MNSLPSDPFSTGAHSRQGSLENIHTAGEAEEGRRRRGSSSDGHPAHASSSGGGTTHVGPTLDEIVATTAGAGNGSSNDHPHHHQHHPHRARTHSSDSGGRPDGSTSPEDPTAHKLYPLVETTSDVVSEGAEQSAAMATAAAEARTTPTPPGAV